MILKNNSKPLYRQVSDYIISGYKNEKFKYGTKLPSENELSRILNISRVSVRGGYDILESSKVITRVKGKGTFLSDNLENNLEVLASASTITNRVIGVVFPEFDNFFPKILKGIESEADKYGYSINIALNTSEQKEKQSIDSLVTHGVSGIIITPNRFADSRKNYTRLVDNSIPFVTVGKPLDIIRCDAVYSDDIAGSYSAVQKIYELGYQNIIHMTSSTAEREAYQERSLGFTKGMRDFYGNKAPLIIDTDQSSWTKLLQDGLQATKTALYLVDDLIAPRIYQQLFSWGYKIPDDVGILGTNNSAICDNMEVTLSSIAHQQEQEGVLAFNLLYAQINGTTNKDSVKHIILDTRFIKRNSL